MRSRLFAGACILAGLCSQARAAALPFGQTQTGTISSAGQSNSYTFSANTNDVVDFTMVATSGSLNPKIQLYNSTGTLLGSANPGFCEGSSAELNTVQLSATGTYTVTVSDCGAMNTGDYSIYAQRTNNPSGASALPLGQTQAGTIGSAAQSNSYIFGGSANDVVDFTMTATSGNLSPKIRLYNPDGTLLNSANPGFCSGSSTELNTVQLPASGTYTVLVGDCSDTNGGNYSIFAQRTENPSGAASLVFGAPPQTGMISSAGQSNSYTFSANANDVIDLTMAATSGKLNPKIRLYNPDGTLLSSANPGFCDGSNIELNAVQASASGTYTVLVGDCGDTNTGNYLIYAQRTNNPAGAAGLPFGQTQAGTIGSATQSSTYTFSGNTNDMVDFTMATTSGNLNPKIRLYSADGMLLSSANPGFCDGSSIELNTVQLPAGGSYTVLVGDCNDTNTGNYSIYAQRTNNPSGAAALIFGGQTQAGTIGSAAQSNSYTFSANASAVVDFTMVATSGNLNPKIRLYNPAGTLLSSANPGFCDGSSIELNSVTLPTSGVYTVLAGDCNDTNTGNYNLSAQCFGVCTSTASSSSPSYIASPATLNFSTMIGGAAPAAQTLTLTSSASGLGFTASSSASWISVNPASGTIPAELQVSVSPAGLSANTYQGTITITVPNANPSIITISVTLVVASAGPAASVQPLGLTFNLTQGAAAATQTVTIGNLTNQAQTFSASASVNSGANWLSVSPTSGTIPAVGSAGLAVTVDPSKLQPGTFTGTVSISVGGKSFTVLVLVTVSSQSGIILSALGLRFEAVIGGSATPPQSVTVLNSGAGTLSFTVNVSTNSGGNWLSVSPPSGTSGSSTGSVTFSVNPAGLSQGDYYGQATFTTSGSANAPQILSVVLNVLSTANSPGAFVQPTGLIFLGSQGGSNPAAAALNITNPSSEALNYFATAFTSNGSNWLTFTPASGSVSANQPASVSIQPGLAGLAAGVYIADLVLTFVPASDSTPGFSQTLHIEIVLIVLPAGSSSSVSAGRSASPRASSCTPSKLVPVFTQLESGFSTIAAWPTPIEVTVVDDCGNPLTSGSVSATFSNGDPALSLVSLQDGHWTATWEPVNTNQQVNVTALAQEIQPALMGSETVSGSLGANSAAPAVNPGGVVSAASFAASRPLAPGSFAAIFGMNLAQGLNQSPQLPLSVQLAGTSVIIAGEQAPLLFTSGQQINAVLPFDLPPNSTQQLLVQTGSAISIPQPVPIAGAQPAVFTMNAEGTGAAIIQAYKPDGTPLPGGSALSAGDVVVIYCTGLGAVNPPVPAGGAASASTLSKTVNPVTATIGGVNATVQFAGLTPGFAELYQVNAIVPSGVPSGDEILLLTASGQQSAPVTIQIQ